MKLTADERRAIVARTTLAKTWPRSLWLYSASGTLCVMRALPDAAHAMKKGGGVDDRYLLDLVDRPNSGGDW